MALGLIPAMVIGASAASETLPQLDIFKRCYIRLVRQVPVETDPLFIAVKSGTKLAADACIELFDRARFDSNYVMQNRTNGQAKAIVRTLHDLHISWFQSKIHVYSPTNDLIRDAEEPALYFTRAALQPSTKFNSVVLHNTGLTGVRDQVTYPIQFDIFRVQRILTYPLGFPFSNEKELVIAYGNVTHDGTKFVNNGLKAIRRPSSVLTKVGDLVGVMPSLSFKLPSFLPISSSHLELIESLKKMITNFEANAHFGGGILGSQGFILNNANLTTRQLAIEYSTINRRLTTRVFEDLLCHQLPTLDDADVSSEVLPSSSHTFQNSTSCMRCHSSIDGMAFGYRNLFIFASAAAPQIPNQTAGMRVDGVTSLIPSATAKLFPLQPPRGRLHYRELVTRTRRSVNFGSLSELGINLSTGQDLYTCAAKRYYQYFTGVNVDLTARATQSLEKYHQDQVLALGSLLKDKQSVRSLLHSIFKSEAFKSSHYLTEKVQ